MGFLFSLVSRQCWVSELVLDIYFASSLSCSTYAFNAYLWNLFVNCGTALTHIASSKLSLRLNAYFLLKKHFIHACWCVSQLRDGGYSSAVCLPPPTIHIKCHLSLWHMQLTILWRFRRVKCRHRALLQARKLGIFLSVLILSIFS